MQIALLGLAPLTALGVESLLTSLSKDCEVLTVASSQLFRVESGEVRGKRGIDGGMSAIGPGMLHPGDCLPIREMGMGGHPHLAHGGSGLNGEDMHGGPAGEWHGADAFVVSAFALATGGRYLMPRLDRVLLLTESAPAGAHSMIQAISPSAPLEQLQHSLSRLMNNAAAAATSQQAEQQPLTQREKEVLRLSATGLTVKEIAARLFISQNTVLTHRKNIAAKLGLHTPAALTHYAMTHGLL